MHTESAMQQTEAAVTAETVTAAITAPATSSALAPHRKRKERHESAGSSQIAQDRKVIRSNSQERPCEGSQELENSNDATQKVVPSNQTENCNDTPLLPLHEHNSPMAAVAPMEEEETEHERRRSSERFASFPRSSTPRTGGSNRRYHQPRRQRRSGALESKENTHEGVLHHHHHHHHHQQRHADDTSSDNISHSFLQLHPQEDCESRERSPSPATPRAVPPLLDLSTLHHQVESAEPMPSQAPHHRVPEDSHVLLSPRNSMILTRRLDPNVAPSPPVEHAVGGSRRRDDGNEGKMKQLTKHINSLKKKIKVYEEQYELQNGFRPSHADKLANRELKKMFSELNRLRKELKQMKEDCAAANNVGLTKSLSLETDTTEATTDETPPTPGVYSLTDTVRELEHRLQDKRDDAGRPCVLEDMSREQLLAEKVALQKALLSLESKHGRPVSRTDRDMVRPLYDRYRSLKRLVVRSGGSKLRDSMSELATILEHEAMDFSAAPESSSETAAVPADAAVTADLPESSAKDEPQIADFSENFHSLPLDELLSRQQEAREEKKRLRRALREFEEEFQRGTGRRLQREDREPRQQEYASYKQAKAKLRLLEALLAKHGQGPRSC